MSVNESWLQLLFKRFHEIYNVRADAIDKTLSDWVFALEGISAEQIKYALDVCRKDVGVLPTAKLFRELCMQGLSVSCNTPKSTNKPITALPSPGRVVPLQWPSKSPESHNNVSNKVQDYNWQQELIAMDESAALMSLTPEQRYDRTRLLTEKQGREQVSRMQALTSTKTDIKRRDWE